MRSQRRPRRDRSKTEHVDAKRLVEFEAAALHRPSEALKGLAQSGFLLLKCGRPATAGR
jgi:hypothetical protein